jgi:segregation and condensation protein B
MHDGPAAGWFDRDEDLDGPDEDLDGRAADRDGRAAVRDGRDADGDSRDDDADDGDEDREPGPGLRTSLEAILLVADEPVADNLLAQIVERPTEAVAAALRELADSYTAEQRGFDLREVAGGWRFYTRAECAGVVERFVSDGQEVRLTQAALETLAVVAYRQPVSRARVSAVRGVNCDGVMRTLVLRGLVEEAGTDPETGATLFQTTSYFLERLGLPGLAALPELAPFLPDHLEDELDSGHERGR